MTSKRRRDGRRVQATPGRCARCEVEIVHIRVESANDDQELTIKITIKSSTPGMLIGRRDDVSETLVHPANRQVRPKNPGKAACATTIPPAGAT